MLEAVNLAVRSSSHNHFAADLKRNNWLLCVNGDSVANLPLVVPEVKLSVGSGRDPAAVAHTTDRSEVGSLEISNDSASVVSIVTGKELTLLDASSGNIVGALLESDIDDGVGASLLFPDLVTRLVAEAGHVVVVADISNN